MRAEGWPSGLPTVTPSGQEPVPADTEDHAMSIVRAGAATVGAFEPEAAECPAIHFAIRPQAIEIECPYSGIFYS
jgi:hypothetical protein